MSLIPRNQLFDRDRFFDNFFAPFAGDTESAGAFLSPRVDISDKKDHFEISAELPGINKDDIHVTLKDGVLTLSAESQQEDKEEKDGKIIRQERRYGKFVRSFNLGGEVEEDNISANFKDGVLTLKAPKLSEPKVSHRRIEIL